GSSLPARARCLRSGPSSGSRCAPGPALPPPDRPTEASWPPLWHRAALVAPGAGYVPSEPRSDLAGRERRHPVAILPGQRVAECLRPLLVRREPVAAERRLRVGGDLARERDGFRERPPGRDETVGEAHAQRLLARDPATREDQIEGVAVADQPRETHRPTVHQRDAPAPAEDAEPRILRRHPEVAPGGELEPASDGMALDGGDHGLREEHPGRSDRTVAVGRDARDALRVAAAHRLQIGAAAELASGTRQARDGEG